MNPKTISATLKKTFLPGIRLPLAFFLVALLSVSCNQSWTGFGEYTTKRIEEVNPKTGGVEKVTREIQASKTAWDWMQFIGTLAIPIVLAIGGYVINQKEQKRMEENLRENILTMYLDQISNLILENNNNKSNEKWKMIWWMVRLRTLTALDRLDKDVKRKSTIIRFLSEAKLGKSVDLSGVKLKKVNLSELNLCDADFSNADLSGADLGGANLSDAKLFSADLTNANLSQATLCQIKLIGANLSGANLCNSDLTNANLTKGTLINTKLCQAEFIRADLSDANLSGADLTNANLKDANINYANFSKANLKGVKLIVIKSCFGTVFTEANLSGAALCEMNLCEIDFSGADLTGADLNNTNLTRVNLTNANLTGTNFTGANLSGANLSNANLSSANLKFAINIEAAQIKAAKNWESCSADPEFLQRLHPLPQVQEEPNFCSEVSGDEVKSEIVVSPENKLLPSDENSSVPDENANENV